MIKLVAILVLSTNLSVAVETDAGWVQRTFSNSPSGAEELVGYAEQAIGDPSDGIHVVVGWLDDNDDDTHIINKLVSLDLKHGLAGPQDIKVAAVKHGLSEQSPVAVAMSFKDRFDSLRAKPKR